jgi:hypothetical protein
MEVNAPSVLEWTGNDGRVTLDLRPLEAYGALARLRTRLLQRIDALSAGEAELPTRCSEWRVVDVVNHLADTTGWATTAIDATLAGRPGSGVWDRFDVVATPKSLTDAAPRDLDAARARLHEAMAANMRQITAVLPVRERLTDTPLGPQPFPVAVTHVLWDTWLHERDLCLPRCEAVPQHEDEVRLCAIYTLRLLGVMFALRRRARSLVLRLHGGTETALRLDVGDGETRVRAVDSVDDGTPVLSGDAAGAIDALSGRGDLAAALQGPDGIRAELSPLGRYFAGR